MGITRKILDWSDKKYEEVLEDDRPVVGGAKAFGLGFLEGTIDGLVIFGGIAYVCTVVNGVVKLVKK